jgi:hypothetical protein
MKTIRIGTGAGFADDRIEPAINLVARGNLDYLVFECLAERTIALAQLDKLQNEDGGYSEWLEDRIDAVLHQAIRNRTCIITNMGAANPVGAARKIAELAARKGLVETKVIAVTGDDVLPVARTTDLELLDQPGTMADLSENVISANAYLGVDGILEALDLGANVIVTGRTADPSLFLAPLIYEFGWQLDDWNLLGKGTAVGHLLECGTQVSGGYFADPATKPVASLGTLGLPIAEVSEDGSFIVTKTPGTGGCVTVATVTEQLLYEVHNPARYLTPDVVADFSGAELTQVGKDVVSVTGVAGRPRPERLKVSVGYTDGYTGEGQISYAGPGAVARGRLALKIVRHRLALIGVPLQQARYELIGVDAIHRGRGAAESSEPREVRVRVIGRTTDMTQARRIGHEVTALWLNGPAGGAGAHRRAERNVAIASVLIPRDWVTVSASCFEGAHHEVV